MKPWDAFSLVQDTPTDQFVAHEKGKEIYFSYDSPGLCTILLMFCFSAYGWQKSILLRITESFGMLSEDHI